MEYIEYVIVNDEERKQTKINVIHGCLCLLEVKMLVRVSYMSMKRINFMPVHMNGDRSTYISLTMKSHAWNQMNSLLKKVSFSMGQQ
jgi:hypothetical protein